MRTELPPLPSEANTIDDRAEIALDAVIQDIDRRLKILESAFSQMTVNNLNRQVMWTGPVNQSLHSSGGTATVAIGGGGGTRGGAGWKPNNG